LVVLVVVHFDADHHYAAVHHHFLLVDVHCCEEQDAVLE
jgi:hypothetical protein